MMSPRDAADLEWPVSVGVQVILLKHQAAYVVETSSCLCCWNIKLLKLPRVMLTNVCGTNSHNWWAKGLREVGVVKIFCDSDSSSWKSFRLRSHSPAWQPQGFSVSRLQGFTCLLFLFFVLWISTTLDRWNACFYPHRRYLRLVC